jgi:hypothetical protein
MAASLSKITGVAMLPFYGCESSMITCLSSEPFLGPEAFLSRVFISATFSIATATSLYICLRFYGSGPFCSWRHAGSFGYKAESTARWNDKHVKCTPPYITGVPTVACRFVSLSVYEPSFGNDF